MSEKKIYRGSELNRGYKAPSREFLAEMTVQTPGFIGTKIWAMWCPTCVTVALCMRDDCKCFCHTKVGGNIFPEVPPEVLPEGAK